MNKLRISTVIVALIATTMCAKAQTPSVKKATVSAWDGMAVVGYVNDGGYFNFGGPTVKFIKKPFSIGFGVLPTMRIKEDKVAAGAKKNAAVMPTAGFGFTAVFKHLVLQVPFYYNAKTASADGKWNAGIGIGFKF